MNFRFLCMAAAIGLSLSNIPVFAQTSADPAAKPRTAQQNRMASCNTQAGDRALKGQARQQFMSRCLKGEAADKPKTAQQQKMVGCNQQANAQALKGDARKQFMSSCLKG